MYVQCDLWYRDFFPHCMMKFKCMVEPLLISDNKNTGKGEKCRLNCSHAASFNIRNSNIAFLVLKELFFPFFPPNLKPVAPSNHFTVPAPSFLYKQCHIHI